MAQALRKQRQASLSEFEASWVYVENFRPGQEYIARLFQCNQTLLTCLDSPWLFNKTTNWDLTVWPSILVVYYGAEWTFKMSYTQVVSPEGLWRQQLHPNGDTKGKWDDRLLCCKSEGGKGGKASGVQTPSTFSYKYLILTLLLSVCKIWKRSPTMVSTICPLSLVLSPEPWFTLFLIFIDAINHQILSIL